MLNVISTAAVAGHKNIFLLLFEGRGVITQTHSVHVHACQSITVFHSPQNNHGTRICQNLETKTN